MESTKRDYSISVFFPAFNDAKSIAPLIAHALAVLPELTRDYEVIVINDGSADNTGSVLEELARNEPHLKVVHHEENLGYGAALRTGFGEASKDLVFYTDGDGQYDVRELPVLFALLTDQVDAVNGFKLERADEFRRKFAGDAYNKISRFLFRLPIRDVDCDFRLIRRTALQSIDLKSSSGAICVELVCKLHQNGAVFVEAPVNHYPRIHGRSQFFTFGRVLQTLLDLGGLWVRLAVLGSPKRQRGQVLAVD